MKSSRSDLKISERHALHFSLISFLFSLMKKNQFPLFLAQIFCLLMFVGTVSAQPLPKVELKQVFQNLQIDRPVWMSEAPDGSGRLFFVAQAGKIFIVKKNSDGGDAKEFLNIENRHPFFDNEDGLMGIAWHRGFKTNGLFYVYYNQKNPADQHSQPQNYPFRSIVSEFKVSTNDPDVADMGSERILFQVQQPFSNHKGGELAFGPDGYLYLGLGDGGDATDPFGSGQNTGTLLAKMLRIDVNSRTTAGSGNRSHELNYGIPSDNPFVNEPDMGGRGARKEIFAYGLRNPWRYSFDRETGDLWVGDVGQDLWEEVDLVTKGGNYGWNVREGAHHFKPGPEGARYIDPVMEYPHRPDMKSQCLFPDHPTGNCVIGGYVYRGKQFPALAGIYIYADYSPGNIYGFRYDRDAHKVTAEGTLLQQPKGITSFAEDQDGELYVLTQGGQIYSITVPQ
jgi:glucose/arabinose dehydrogenase